MLRKINDHILKHLSKRRIMYIFAIAFNVKPNRRQHWMTDLQLGSK